MSVQPRTRRATIGDIVALKGQRPIVALTAYTAPMAALIDSHVDVILVGDSLGNVIYGFETTLPVTLDMMIAHGAAVVRGSTSALVVVDLPFGSYQGSPQQAFDAAARVLAETGATAIKLEGGEEMAATVAFLTRRGVPVMGHIGLTPQSVHTLGGFKAQGRDEAGAARLTRDARAIGEAGAFSIVLEGVIADLVEDVVGAARVPVIGIGASAGCDGQVLVIDDMLGLSPARAPKFVKRYGELWRDVESAVTAYAGEVRARQFPSEDHLYRARK